MIAFMMEVQKYVFIIIKFTYIKRYESRQTQCCNLFELHSGVKLPKANFLIILPKAKILLKSFNATTPGMKRCVTCKNQARKEHPHILTQNKQSLSASETDGSKFANPESQVA